MLSTALYCAGCGKYACHIGLYWAARSHFGLPRPWPSESDPGHSASFANLRTRPLSDLVRPIFFDSLTSFRKEKFQNFDSSIFKFLILQMSLPIKIKSRPRDASVTLSTSPTFATSPPGPGFALGSEPKSYVAGRALAPFPLTSTPRIKVLLLENINATGVELLTNQGYAVTELKKALGEDELIETLNKNNFNAVGIRSKTKVTARVINSCPSLLAIGCFCIGTNQVDLLAAAKRGIAVFNSPFSNSRSVAELVIGEIIALSRQFTDRSDELKANIWNKVSKNCWEIRGKTLGIVGYGHIGSQLSVLAEAMGLTVVYFDAMPIMPLGQARQLTTLDELLATADFVTLHVPELPETINMISEAQLAQMKQGAYLINNARGRVVDIPALVSALQSGHLGGAAIDVYPAEPAANGPTFNDALNSWTSELVACKNLILTPHIGGSTEEAQSMIGSEVGAALIRYINYGSSLGAVNFPEVNLRPISDHSTVRLCHIHLNQPGVLKQVNAILGDYNVEKQFSDSKGEIAYLLTDIVGLDEASIRSIYDTISAMNSTVATRVLS